MRKAKLLISDIDQVAQLAQDSFPNGGTILEFGVASGCSYIQLANRILKDWPCKLIGFDSFLGLPKEEDGVQKVKAFAEGRYSFPKSIVENKLKKLGVILPDERFSLVEGWFKDTLTKDLQKKIDNVVLVNIDSDLYISAMLVLNFVKPFLQKRTIIHFDNWRHGTYDNEMCGEQLAFKHWIKANPEIDYKFFNYYEQKTIKKFIKILDKS